MSFLALFRKYIDSNGEYKRRNKPSVVVDMVASRHIVIAWAMMMIP